MLPLSYLGFVALLLALPVAVYTVVAGPLALRLRSAALLLSARNGVLALAALLTLASATLVHAFVTHDFGVRYVAEQSSRDMALQYVITAFYGGQAGSLLYWAWTLSLLSVAVVLLSWQRARPLMPYVIAVLVGVETFFLVLLNFVSNPLERLPFVPADGRGLNPLLKDPGMLVHPPLLLAGYMSWTVPFAFAIAALLSGRLWNEWLIIVRPWALLAFGILGSGLLMGSWWAYHVLGWGGYWGWDPVENAALMPWLTGTAFLHSIMVQERRGMLKVWNLGLAIATFALAIFGTFVVRSGILTSVHSFAVSAIGPFFFGFLTVVLLGSLALLFYRLPLLRDEQEFDSFVSRESAFLINNLLFVALTFAVFWGTIYPLLSEAVRNVKITVGPPYYNQVAGPLLLALLLLMGVAPLMAWRRASLDNLARSLRWPAAVALAGTLLAALAGAVKPGALAGILAATFVAGTVGLEFWRGMQMRRRLAREPAPLALTRLVGRNRRRYGGYIVHLAVVLIALGTVGSSFFQQQREVTLAPGEQARVGRYTLTYRELTEYRTAEARVMRAELIAEQDGKEVARLYPERQFHKNWEQQPTTRVAIETLPPRFEDLYAVLVGWEEKPDGYHASLHLFVNPAVSLIWIGGAVFLVATLVTLWPQPQPARAPVRVPAGALRRTAHSEA
jgi:cytochrome c-type biogenesis protein CcmF